MNRFFLSALLVLGSSMVVAEEEVQATYERKAITPELAYIAAKAAMDSCRNSGFQTAVAVVDFTGTPVVLLRDRLAGFHTTEIAVGKARAAFSFRTNTTELTEATKPDSPQAAIRLTPGYSVIPGGVMIDAGGSMIAAIGVSGAPGGDLDEICANDGIAAIQEVLDFE